MEIIGWLGMGACVVIMMAAILHRGKEQYPDDEQCPVCGYHCLGKGGRGCIDKPNAEVSSK